jgi:hypothetical protein
MAKKSKKFEAETPEVDGNVATDNTDAPEVQASNGEDKEPIKRGFHLVSDTADIHGRTNYRFGKYNQMPKKAPRINVLVDGESVEMAVTNSGGYAAKKGYNGYLTARGHIGWILFGDDVDPQNEDQFPDGLSFNTVDGTCEANPIREPANWENENKRREAATAAAQKRAAERKAAADLTNTEQGDHAEQAAGQ